MRDYLIHTWQVGLGFRDLEKNQSFKWDSSSLNDM